jgi:signal transduction histidine kinase
MAPFERLRRLYEVSKVIHSTLEPREALRLIVREAVRLVRATSGSIALHNPTNGLLEIEAAYRLPPGARRLRLRLGEGITGWVARTGKPARIGDVLADPRYIPVRTGVRSELAVPLEVNGEPRGVLNVDSDRVEAFTADDQELLEELAGQAAQVIHHTWLYEQFRQKAGLFETLVQVGQSINSTFNLDDVLQSVTREACELIGGKMSALLLLDETGEWLDLRASHGAGDAYRRRPRLSVGESLLGVVLRRRKPLQVENVQASGRYQNTEIARREGLISLLSVPLVFRGSAIGALSVYIGYPHAFSNEEIRILSALADLSAIAIEKARLYERVVDVEEQLRENEKLSALGLLAAEVAHEIRNPLTVMKMLFQSLDLRFPASDPRAEDVEIMGRKMEDLNRIVERMLDFARKAEPDPMAVDLNHLVRELGLLTRHKLKQHQIEVVYRLDPNLPRLMADPTQLEQAFLNLILNAVDAMPRGGRLTIATRLSRPRDARPGTTVEVQFRDTGRGMSADQQSRAFKQLLGTTKRRGTGLGLAIVARIIEGHGGRIAVRSAVGRGTTFSLQLPVAGQPPAELRVTKPN